jgi:hypothetical protein
MRNSSTPINWSQEIPAMLKWNIPVSSNTETTRFRRKSGRSFHICHYDLNTFLFVFLIIFPHLWNYLPSRWLLYWVNADGIFLPVVYGCETCSLTLREAHKLSRYSDWLLAGQPGFDFRERKDIFLFSTASRPAPGPTQPPIQWVPGPLSPGVKWPGREVDHLPPSNAGVKNGGAIPQIPNTFSWRCA